MKKQTINLYLDFEFTSLSPDAQPISLGIVASTRELIDMPTLVVSAKKGIIGIPNNLSFYAEFSDYDINRCDDWVRENVISKLLLNEVRSISNSPENADKRNVLIKGDTQMVKSNLSYFLQQFSDYEIQVVVDCGTWDWYHFLQLAAEWDEIPGGVLLVDAACIPPGKTIEEFAKEWEDAYKNPPSVVYTEIIPNNNAVMWGRKIGLPRLPPNICPVPIDLNDIIALKMDISPKEAFDICRETIGVGGTPEDHADEKHNASWDAIVIKACYEKLMK